MQPLIQNGHVFAAQPPLYKVTVGKDNYYCYSDQELNELLDSLGRPKIVLQRYKGLGEMTAEQLWQTTMSPEHRVLLKVTMEDAMAADDAFSRLMGDDPEQRRQFIEANATLVKDLDV